MPSLTITSSQGPQTGAHAIEIVERKGLGHPDTLCDALAEQLSRALCRFYLEHFGLVLHHNVDKVLLWGGTSQPAYGGGEVLAPMEIFFAGRATCEYKGIRVPVPDLVQESCRHWLRTHMHALDPERHVKIHSLIRPGSPDLVDLYLRQKATGIPLANDTSCGVGYAPLSPLERMVLQVEQRLNAPECKSAHPVFGEDIKVMGVRRHDNIELTIACAFVDRHIQDVQNYVEQKARLAQLVKEYAEEEGHADIDVSINHADDIERESLYLTVTGTSAESGDDGEVGRGNRVNGLITPYRPMNMEAAAGKNPVTHVGKLYNIMARQIAEALVGEIPAIGEAYCYLVSRIGSPVNEPHTIDLRLVLADQVPTESLRPQIEAITRDILNNSAAVQQALMDGLLSIY